MRKKRWQTGIYLLLYILLLTYIADFDIRKLLDMKSFLVLLTGAFLLTLPFYEKGMDKEEFLYIYGAKAIEAGLIQVFLLSFVRLSEKRDYERLLVDVALCFRPMLYAFCIRFILANKGNDLFLTDEKGYKGKEIQTAGQTEEGAMPSYEDCIAAGLTRREAEIALFICRKYSNKEIADALVISETTVKKHISNIFEKTEIKKREELMMYLKGNKAAR